jgi:hypothetical protein
MLLSVGLGVLCKQLTGGMGRGVNFTAIMWIIGILFLGAAVAGQSMKILDNELPALTSGFARITLAIVGAVALVLGAVVYFQLGPRPLVPGGPTTNAPDLPVIIEPGDKPVHWQGVFRGIQNINCLCMDLPSNELSTQVIMFTCKTETEPTSQTWKRYGDKIQNINGLCMDLPSNELSTRVIMFTCKTETEPTSQTWKMLQ